ncbi:hypothetical protein [Actinopolymorpha alba]|uniref:hypothetical protein n=1 Tax=Actinopolymorpha alba TaxID=533267 RepID=UPI00036088A3|nr:hypothetical protein [Actinopolymorpha alba]
MNQSRRVRVPPHLAAVVVILVFMLANLRPTDNPPSLDQRETVAAELDQVPGITMVLPVELPPGYEFGRYYRFGDASLEEPLRVEAREVTFLTDHGKPENGLPVIVLCVEYANAKQSRCSAGNPADRIQRRHGPALLTFYAASDGSREFEAWKNVQLTTDLEKVRWLH